MKSAIGLFCISVLSPVLASAELPITSQISVPVVEYCELFERPLPIRTGLFRTTAYMSYSTVSRIDGGDPFLYSPKCNDSDHFAVFDTAKNVWGRYPKFFDSLPPERHHVISITFDGRLEVANSHLFGSLDGWSRAKALIINTISLRLLPAPQESILPNQTAEAPEAERIERLQASFWLFLQSLLRSNGAEPSLLSDDFVLVNYDGAKISRTEVLSRSEPVIKNSMGEITLPKPLSDQLRISRRILNATATRIIGLGTIEFRNHRSILTYASQVTFKLYDGEWKIQKAVITRRRRMS